VRRPDLAVGPPQRPRGGLGKLNVLLVVMPFAACERRPGRQPAEGHLSGDDVPATSPTLNLAFAESIGPRSYVRMVTRLPDRALSIGWCFAECLWGRSGGLPDSYVDDVLRDRWRSPRERSISCCALGASRRAFSSRRLPRSPGTTNDVVGFSCHSCAGSMWIA